MNVDVLIINAFIDGGASYNPARVVPNAERFNMIF